jgi:ribonuclease J
LPDGILLSHAHLDHSGLLHLTRPEVPIHTSRGTSKAMLAAAVFSGQNQLDPKRFREAKAGQQFVIGDFRVTPFSVDHSAFDSFSFLVEAKGKSILYSGDLRLHGRKPGMAKSLIEQVGPRQIDVLLMEGTHFGSENFRGLSEFDLEEQAVEHVREAPSIVFTAFSPLDVDRLVTMYRVSQRTKRTFVADAYAAFVLHLVASQARIPRPITERGIRVYFNQGFVRRNIENLSQLFLPHRITLEEVLAEPRKHLMVFRPSMTDLDFGGQLPPRSRVLYGYWKGYLKNPDWIELRKQLEAVEGDFISAHASGHIYVSDIIDFVRAIGPRLVIPIHTFEPEQFRSHFPNTVLLSDGQAYSVE